MSKPETAFGCLHLKSNDSVWSTFLLHHLPLWNARNKDVHLDRSRLGVENSRTSRLVLSDLQYLRPLSSSENSGIWRNRLEIQYTISKTWQPATNIVSSTKRRRACYRIALLY